MSVITMIHQKINYVICKIRQNLQNFKCKFENSAIEFIFYTFLIFNMNLYEIVSELNTLLYI